jgi:hypothetical protein
VTQTEQLVRDAIAATAGQVPPDRLPALDLSAVAGSGRRRMLAGRAFGFRTALTGAARRGYRLLVPLTAAASVAAIAATVLVFSNHARVHVHVPGAARLKLRLSPLPRPANPLPDNDAVPPPYYAALTATNPAWRYHPLVVTVRATATGRVLATVRPPKPFTTFTWISGAGDDRTFVLAANKLLLPGGPYTGQHTWPQAPVRFYLLRFSPAGSKTSLTELPITAVTSELRVASIALSPDGAFLAVALGGRKISVFSVATGQARTWSLSRAQARDNVLGRLAWTADDQTIGFWASNGIGTQPAGEFLLNTAIADGNLATASKAVRISRRAGLECEFGALLSPSGTVVTCAVMKRPSPLAAGPSGTSASEGFAEFSSRTGRLIRHVDQPAARGDRPFLLWVSSSGDAFIAWLNFPRPSVIAFGAGAVTGIPWPAPIAIGQSPFSLPAW